MNEIVIYHYTKMENLLSMIDGIIKGDSDNFTFWGSSIFYMNDPREFYQGYDLLMARCLPELEDKLEIGPSLRISEVWGQDKLKEKKQEYDNMLIDNMQRDGELPFIVSFSKLADDYVMWNKYGDRGKGVCLAFSQSEFRFIVGNKSKLDIDVALTNNIDTFDVFYGDFSGVNFNYSDIIERQYKRYVSEAKELTNPLDLLGLKIKYLSVLASVFAPMVKSEDFDFEKEARIIQKEPNINNVECRCNADGDLIPYIKIKVPVSCFKGVVLGAGISKMDLSKKALERQFDRCQTLSDKYVNYSELSSELFK